MTDFIDKILKRRSKSKPFKAAKALKQSEFEAIDELMAFTLLCAIIDEKGCATTFDIVGADVDRRGAAYTRAASTIRRFRGENGRRLPGMTRPLIKLAGSHKDGNPGKPAPQYVLTAAGKRLWSKLQ